MRIFNNSSELNNYILSLKTEGNKTIGFVPTMGALHQGHLSLIQKSKEDNDITVCSIYVNPTQFDNQEDLDKYPRNTENDTKLLLDNQCDVLFLPTNKDIYPEGLQSEKFDFDGLDKKMEGKFRTSHFDGVGTVVSKLLNIVCPDRAYFGEKDFQQLRIIETMVKKLGLNIKIIALPILREEDGLAMSSRNTRLNHLYREQATIIFKTLKEVERNHTSLSVKETNDLVKTLFRDSLLELEYFSLCDEKTLEEIRDWKDSQQVRAFIAAYAGNVRLIDNMKII